MFLLGILNPARRLSKLYLKDSPRTSQRTQSITIRYTNFSLLFVNVLVVGRENQMKRECT